MRITQQPQLDSSDEEVTLPASNKKPVQAKQEAVVDPARFAIAIRAVWARPSLSKQPGNNTFAARLFFGRPVLQVFARMRTLQ